jgi:hypothetical protein
MRRRIVAAEREPEPEQAHDQPDKILGKDDHHQKKREKHGLEDEHRLAAEIVGERAEGAGSDQDAEQRGSAN